MNHFPKPKIRSGKSKNSTSHRLECETLENRLMLSAVEIIAAGVTNAEQMELQIDGQVVQTWDNIGGDAYGGQFESYNFSTADDISASQVRIAFTNDLYDVDNNIDRNLRIDAVVIDGVRFETEDPSVFSTATWLPADGIVPGNRESEYLHSDGYVQFSDGTPPTGSLVEVRAAGDEGGEQFELQIDGVAVANFTTTSAHQTFQYQANTTIDASQIRIAFTNDAYDPANNIDNNLQVDFIAIDGQTFQTESPTVYSTGTWLAADGIEPGFRQSEKLHTNGYFEFDADPVVEPQPGSIGLTLDNLTIDEDLGLLNFVVFRADGTDGSVSVDYSTTAGSAGAGDFETVSGTLVFDDDITGQQVSLSIIDDDLVESDETFTFTLSNPTGGATLGAITTQTVTIADNDEIVAGIIFQDSFESVSNWTTNPAGNDDATTGQWEIGSPQSTTSSGITLQPNAGHTGPGALVTGLAAGSSVGTFDIDSGVTSVISPTVDIPVGAEVELRFEYSFAYLDNATNDDYFAVSIVSGGVTTELFDDHAHAYNQTSTWNLVTLDISQYAGSTIQILFEAADLGGGSLIEAAVDDVVVEILPNLPGTFNVSTTGVNLDEAAGTAEVIVVRNAGRAGAASIDFATLAGTASTSDFTPVSGTLNFADGQSEATINIPITDDSIVEDLESFEVVLSNPTGGANLGTNDTTSVTIVDNDNTVADYLPDLTPIASTLTERLSIDTSEIPGRSLLRFSTEVANGGDGPLELWGGSISGSSQQVFQRIYQADGGFRDALAGEFVYHAGHGHIHFEGFATYDLKLTDASGQIIASGGKTSFCLINIRQPLPDVTASAGLVHGRGGSSCGQIQGISAGYSDVYSAALDDQWIDITNVADGTYWLEIETDPDNNLQETNESNNTARVQVTINNGQVTSN